MSAIEIDGLDVALSIASDIIYETAPDPQMTRLERLARYLVMSLGGIPPRIIGTGKVEHYTATSGAQVIRVDDMIRVVPPTAPFGPGDARALAGALLRAAEHAEE